MPDRFSVYHLLLEFPGLHIPVTYVFEKGVTAFVSPLACCTYCSGSWSDIHTYLANLEAFLSIQINFKGRLSEGRVLLLFGMLKL